MILIVSSRTDEHARAVAAELTRLGAEHCTVDLSLFPRQIALSVEHTASGATSMRLDLGEEGEVAAEAVRAVWWRRPQPFSIDATIDRPSHQSFAYNECHEAFAGFWHALDAQWINHPACDDRAARKVYQLQVAKRSGLPIPKTLISNDVAKVRSFVSSTPKVIYKAFSATPQQWRETRLLKSEEVALLDNVRHAPVIFQEYVEAAVDLRITVIGDTVFAAAIHSQQTAYPVDFRIDMAQAQVEPVQLPAHTLAQLNRLMSRLGLVYGAIDMRLTPDDRYVFLEINPAGQWLFIEQRTRQPITRALAAKLHALARQDSETGHPAPL